MTDGMSWREPDAKLETDTPKREPTSKPTLLDLSASSLCRGHVRLFRTAPNLTDDPRSERRGGGIVPVWLILLLTLWISEGVTQAQS